MGVFALRLFSLHELKGFSNKSWLYLVCGGVSSVMVVNWFFWFFFWCPTLAVRFVFLVWCLFFKCVVHWSSFIIMFM